MITILTALYFIVGFGAARAVGIVAKREPDLIDFLLWPFPLLIVAKNGSVS